MAKVPQQRDSSSEGFGCCQRSVGVSRSGCSISSSFPHWPAPLRGTQGLLPNLHAPQPESMSLCLLISAHSVPSNYSRPVALSAISPYALMKPRLWSHGLCPSTMMSPPGFHPACLRFSLQWSPTPQIGPQPLLHPIHPYSSAPLCPDASLPFLLKGMARAHLYALFPGVSAHSSGTSEQIFCNCPPGSPVCRFLEMRTPSPIPVTTLEATWASCFPILKYWKQMPTVTWQTIQSQKLGPRCLDLQT